MTKFVVGNKYSYKKEKFIYTCVRLTTSGRPIFESIAGTIFSTTDPQSWVDCTTEKWIAVWISGDFTSVSAVYSSSEEVRKFCPGADYYVQLK